MKGAISLQEGFLILEDKPSFFMIGAKIEKKLQNNDTIGDLNYSFDSIDLSLYFSLDEEDDEYRIDWRINSKITI